LRIADFVDLQQRRNNSERNLEKDRERRSEKDSAEADLYKLLFRDLSTGQIFRQHRETDYYGNFVAKTPKRRPKGSGPKPIVSAFDDNKGYDLIELGKQFVHYAMTELPPKIEFSDENSEMKA
jgi:hypothetical protein